MELKLLHRSLERTITEGLKQTAAYMDRCGTGDGHLIIFDRSGKRTREEKIFQQTETCDGKTIFIWGM